MNIKEHVQKMDARKSSDILGELLERYLEPAFGSLPKKEIDLLILDVLEDLNYLTPEPPLYEVIQKLRVPRSKARSLMYERELRHMDTPELDKRLKRALKNPILQKEGDLFLLEIENPLVSDHLRSKVQTLGYIADSTFSPSLIKLPLNAIVAVIDSYLNAEEKKAVRGMLIKAGAPDTSFKGILKLTIRAVAKKVALDAGDALIESVNPYLAPIIDGAVEGAAGIYKGLFPKKK